LACYSREEGNCLTQLERSYAIEIKVAADHPAVDGAALQQEVSSFVVLLQKTEYRRTGSVESMLVGSGIRDLSEYLDLLGRVTEARKSEYPDDAKRLSERLSSLTKGLSEVSGKQLSSSSQATQKQVQDALGALGNLAGVLQTMSKDAQDAGEIKRLVRDNQVNVEGLIATLRAVALGDTTLAVTYSDQAMRRARASLQAKFEETADPYSRSLLLVERENYLYTDGDTMLKAVNDVFDSLSKSHLALVSLVNDPTDEQKKAIANERLQNFKTVVTALADVVQAVK
jgi:phosphoglycolate phosphatase-like HAD superfamily hydrolase